ncbi:MAG: type II toxin-antitoxin system RelE/ParE family toxin [bacterium]|nr:type II toxin-antitoxin system RelE/ParE family toxin [bacterium]
MKRSLTPEAEDELTEAALWYENRRKGLGIEFLEEAERVFQRIEENPRLYQVVHLDIRRANLRRFPYSVYYVVHQVHQDIVGVLAVHHNSRDPRRWKWRRG